MNVVSRMRNQFRSDRGRVKQWIGRATGNRRLRADGLTDRVSGGVRQLGTDVKDETRRARRRIKRKFDR